MENVTPLISVVIPVYKVEPYLRKCVDSVLNQTYTNLEIILVDDGSPDNCGKICDEYAKTNSRIKVIHQENMGLSMARNTGIKMATGKYIGFVDSDDYIKPEMYGTLLRIMLENDLKVVQCSIQKGENIFFEQNPKSVAVQTFDEAFNNIAYIGNYNSVNKLFLLDLIKDIKFIQGKIYEDILFVSQVWQKIDKIGFTPMAFYYYSQEGESILRSRYGHKNLEGLWVINEAMENFAMQAKTAHCKNLIRKNFLNTLLFHYHGLLENKCLDPNLVNLKKIRDLIRNHSKLEYINPYFILANFLSVQFYSHFFSVNQARLRFQDLLIEIITKNR